MPDPRPGVGRPRIPRWFPTSPSRRYGGGGAWILDGTVHARQVGESRAACGQPSQGWPMLFDRPFDPREPRGCPACAAAVVPQAVARLVGRA